MVGTEPDYGAALGVFRTALTAASRRPVRQDMGFYDVAIAAGSPGLGGFAPVAGGGRRPASKRQGVVTGDGGAGLVVPGGDTSFASARAGVGPGPLTRLLTGHGRITGVGGKNGLGGLVAARVEAAFTPEAIASSIPRSEDLASLRRGEADSSYRAVVTQAQEAAEVGRARRAVERAALHLPAQHLALAGTSFAPPPGRQTAGELSLAPSAHGGAPSSALHGRRTLADSLAAVYKPLGAQRDVDVEQISAEHQQYQGETHRYAAIVPSAPAPTVPMDLERALDDYFFRKSRLPPAGGAGFNPLLSPIWAGLKISG